MRRLTLFCIPLVTVISLLSEPETPWYLHRWFYLGLFLWLWCALVSIHYALTTGLPTKPIPWSLLILTSVFAANALWLGNAYGQNKILIWLATCLPLLIWPTLIRISCDDIKALASGQVLAGLISLPILFSLEQSWYGTGTNTAVTRYAGLGIISALLLLRVPVNPWFRPFFRLGLWTSLLVSGAAILLAGGRAGLIACGLALFLIAGFDGSKAVLRMLIVLTLFGILAVFMPTLYEHQMDSLDKNFSRFEYALSVRLYLAELSLYALLGSPVIGVGAGQTSDLLSMSKDDTFQYPHNLILEVGAEFGTIALLFFVWILWRSIIGHWRIGLTDAWVRTMGLSSLLILLVNAFKGGNLASHRPLYLWIGIGLAHLLINSAPYNRFARLHWLSPWCHPSHSEIILTPCRQMTHRQ